MKPVAMWIRWSDGSVTYDKYPATSLELSWFDTALTSLKTLVFCIYERSQLNFMIINNQCCRFIAHVQHLLKPANSKSVSLSETFKNN